MDVVSTLRVRLVVVLVTPRRAALLLQQSRLSDTGNPMAKSRVSGAKKKIGRPRVDATPVNTRFPPEELRALDAWISRQTGEFSRPEAIRRLVEQALSTSGKKR
jgi:hypothetical protein